MFYTLSLLMGIFISIMIALNGGLTNAYGAYSATVIIHMAGLLVIATVVLLYKERPFAVRHAWFLYMGGAIGVSVTVFNNLAFGRISVSAILALGLLGQSVTSILVDNFGLMGMPVHKFNKGKIWGLLLLLFGIFVMIYAPLDSFEGMAVVFSFLAGVSIIVSRTINAILSKKTSEKVSTLYNYIVGLAVSIIVLLLLGRSEPMFTNFSLDGNVFIYLGGVIGVVVVLMGNILAHKISALYLVLFIFIGQVFAGVIIDIVLVQAFEPRNAIGGVLVATGLCLNLIMGAKSKHAG